MLVALALTRFNLAYPLDLKSSGFPQKLPKSTFWIGLSLFLTLPIAAQKVDTLAVHLPGVQVEALRSASTEGSAPFALSRMARTPNDVALQPGLSLQSTFQGMAGVTVNDRGHAALGERFLIRGVGWRSAFGVRGIQVVLDGIPLTLPDGQGILDIVDPAFIRRAEIVRGPSSTFWGNGSGGVLMLSTDAFQDSTRIGIRGMGGSYGLQQVSADLAIPVGKHRFYGYASSVTSEGYRDYSENRFTRGMLTALLSLGPRTQLRVVSGFAVQDSESPGALTLVQMTENPRGTDVRNVNALAGKESTQFQVGATLNRQTGVGLLSVTAYALTRQLDNPLSFAYIDLGRTAGGARIQLQNDFSRGGWGLGVDAGFQADDRLNFNNVGGERGLAVTVDQKEDVRNLSAFVFGQFNLISSLTLTAGLRADAIDFTLKDHLPGHEALSGDRSFSAVSPSVGLAYRVGPGLLFANYSTAFETPTTTELVNQPNGSAGLNAEVGAQKTKGFELGARGKVGRISYDLAVFRMSVSDQLESFQDSQGRTYFRNSGETKHIGIEIALQAAINRVFSLQTSYTKSQFQFDQGELQDLRLPGIPEHHLFLGLRAEKGGVYGLLVADIVSSTFADNANKTRNDGYQIIDANLGYTKLFVGGAHIQPFIKVSNLLDRTYVGSMVVNAFGGRYFEPSPGRTFQMGVSASF
ncbi:MAG: TonB-dependent receptor [Bacteroidetes bacterium]|nr:TonB-dependent receptor [Bacteroidota bacterium]